MIQTHPLPKTSMTLSDNKALDLSKPNIMGILNVTPDSFSDGGKHNDIDNALKQCALMINSGADIIDIGGESTRPNATPVSTKDESERVLPIVDAISQRFDTIISIDTSTPSLMIEAHKLGAHIWNDVRALKRDNAPETAAKLDIPVVLMHMRGEPDNMLSLTEYDDLITDIKSELTQTINQAISAGVKKEKIILDIGFGFAKNTQQNFQLLKSLASFHDLDYPLMIGLSRKRMLADALAHAGLENTIDKRTSSGTMAHMLAIMQGSSIVRTHDVLETSQALSVITALNELTK